MLAIYDVDMYILLSVPDGQDDSDLTSCCSVLYSPGLLVRACPGRCVGIAHQAGTLSMYWKLLNTPRLLLCSPELMLGLEIVSPCLSTGPSVSSGPLPSCPALCPRIAPRWTVGHALCICPVHLLPEGQAFLLIIGTKEEALGSYPSHRIQLRLGHSQDLCSLSAAGCISATDLSLCYMKNMKMPGDYFCK